MSIFRFVFICCLMALALYLFNWNWKEVAAIVAVIWATRIDLKA